MALLVSQRAISGSQRIVPSFQRVLPVSKKALPEYYRLFEALPATRLSKELTNISEGPIGLSKG
jgi:hypothetical protein